MNAVIVYLLDLRLHEPRCVRHRHRRVAQDRSGEITSFGGLFGYAPGLAVAMTIFIASLAGIPPLGGWIAKFNVFRRARRRSGAAYASPASPPSTP
jgi:NADH-quinone oxidoreductase subunit N